MTSTLPSLNYNEKSYKLLAFDLDGTLLNTEGKIHKKNAEVLSRVHALGIPIVIATGRIYPGAKYFADQISPQSPVISMNGAYIAQNGHCLYKKEIPVEQCLEAVNFLTEKDLYWHVYLEDSLIASALAHGALYYHNLNKTLPADRVLKIEVPDDPAERLRNFRGGILKFIVMSENPDMLEKSKAYFYKHNLSITSSWSNNFEVMATGISKGFGLHKVCDHLGISPAECISFGDNINDLEMLKASGLSVAMKNAGEELHTITDLIAPHHNEGGVGILIEELFGSQIYSD